MKKTIITINILIACLIYSNAQTPKNKIIEIGNKSPDFVLSDIQHYNVKTAALNDLQDKWIVLDFWTASCTPCITSLPKIDRMQRTFRDQLQFFLVGWDDGEPARKNYERFRIKYKFNLPVVFDNSLFKLFNVSSVPHAVVIDNNGVIKAITSSSELTEDVIQRLIAGDDAQLTNKSEVDNTDFNILKPLLIDGNGGADTSFLYRSVLMKWNKAIPATGSTHIDAKVYGNMIQVTGLPLRSLYFLAYMDTLYPYPSPSYTGLLDNYGRYWMRPVLELADSSEFMWQPGSEENVYCYSLIIPKKKATTGRMQSIMQADLQKYFGYSVAVESRTMPCWKLVANDRAKKALKTKAKKTTYVDNFMTGFIFRNVPVKDVIAKLWINNQLEPPFIDATGITGNIDITIDADLTDFDDFRSALKKNGLELVKDQVEMKVIVIR